jgi:heme-degrading monooxygenase HmoA
MGSRMAYVIVWDFRVAPGTERQFEQAYGADGEWVQCFRWDHAYIRTDLLRDTRDAGRYVTSDVWESEAAYRAFRAAHTDEYGEIDARCEALTESEREVGSFVTTKAFSLVADGRDGALLSRRIQDWRS